MHSVLRLVIPEWRGGVNPDYVLGSELLSCIAPPDGESETVRIQVDTDFRKALGQMDGIDGGGFLLRQMQETARVLEEKQPDQVIVFGGDCSVTQAPFAYLRRKYGEELGILWLDAHPDVAGPRDSSHLHEMVLANLLGQNPGSALTRVEPPVAPARAALAGLIEERLRHMDRACKELGLPIFAPEMLRETSRPLLDWLRAAGVKRLAVHWDLDVLSPEDFRSIYPAEPYTDPADFPAAVGRMTLDTVGRVLRDVGGEAEIVGLSITEHLPWDGLRLRRMLAGLPIFGV